MPTATRYRATFRLTVASAILNIGLALIKLIVGFIGHSQALIADGIHSFSDLLTDGIVLLAAKAASKGPDTEHPYGHGRIETAATIVVAMVLLAVGFAVFYDAIAALFNKQQHIVPELSVLVIAALSILGNEIFYQISMHVNKRWQSQLITSNAQHHRSDAYTSIIVLFAAGGAMLHLPYVDMLGAGIIALLILKMAISMMITCFSELIDTGADSKTLQQISTVAQNTAGVQAVHALRTRHIANRLLIDIHVIVNPTISVSEGHFISEQVEQQLKQALPQLQDVIVHIDAEDDEAYPNSVNLTDRASLMPLIKENLPEHTDRIELHYLSGKIHIDIYMAKEYILSSQQQQDACSALQKVENVDQIKFFYQ